MAKAMVKERTIRDNLEISSGLLSETCDSCPSNNEDLDTIQSYVLLVNLASWTGAKFLPEALFMGTSCRDQSNGVPFQNQIE